MNGNGQQQQEFVVGGRSKVDRYKWRADTRAGELRWIHKKDLRVDHRYQRQLNENKVKAIAASFSWPAFGALTVAERTDGALFLITGQHRKAAVDRRSDVTDVPCVVFRMTDIREEADAFLTEATQKKPLTSVERFKAQLETGDPTATLVDRLLSEAGRSASVSVSGDGSTTIRCISVMMNAARTNPDRLTRVWLLVTRLCDGRFINEMLLDGLLMLDAKAKEPITAERWSERIISVGPERLLEAARRAAAYYAKGGAKVWSLGMLEAINKGLRNRLKLKTGEGDGDDEIHIGVD